MMRLAFHMFFIAVLTLCQACNRAPDIEGEGSTTEALGAEPADEALPAAGAFVGTAWVAVGGPERGAVLAFLPNRTLLMDACPGPLRILEWGIVNGRIRWRENPDSIPIEAEVALPGKNELRLTIVGRSRPEVYVAASPPYVCPEAQR